MLGIIIGMFLNLSITDFECTNYLLEHRRVDFNYSTIKTVWVTNVTRKSTKKPTQLIRPRYYSTELGIKEKLFIGVLTSEEKITSLAVHVNKTVNHLVDKVKFFITAQHKIKRKFNYSGLVGFTDTRNRYRPFQIIKYIGDNYLQDYDYYFLMNDYDYLNARKLKETVEGISVSMNVYMGNPVHGSSYCNLDSGILLSNSVLGAMMEHLDWCVMNAVTDNHSQNIGRCVYYSTKLECQKEIQGQKLPSYELKRFVLIDNMHRLTKEKEFNEAVTVFPLIQGHDHHLLHSYYSKERLVALRKEIIELEAGLPEDWPAGERKGAIPATRFDLPKQYYFNTTHMFFPDDSTIIRKHTKGDSEDINSVISHVKAKVEHLHSGKYQFRRLVNGYRSFDLSRGMDYKLDIGFRDLFTGKDVIKRFEVCKPLGNVEFIPAPYVTENNRVTLLLPVEETETEQVKKFIDCYSKTIMERREKTLLMLVFLYQANTTSKGKEDVFGEIKEIAVRLSNKYKSEDTKIAWVSIRLPQSEDFIDLANYGSLNFALIDLALKKIGLDSLILIVDAYSEFTYDFLNRVRMNTIGNFQIFSPIPFRFYNPTVTQMQGKELHKNAGHFDNQEYRYLSFYAKDYVFARKQSKHLIPLIRVDNDTASVLTEETKHFSNVFEMFVKFSAQEVHCLRAPEISLKVMYHEEPDESKGNWFMGTQAQLSKLVLQKAEELQLDNYKND